MGPSSLVCSICHNQLFCSNNFIFIFVGRLLYKEFGKKILEKSLCFPGVNFTNLANYWDF